MACNIDSTMAANHPQPGTRRLMNTWLKPGADKHGDREMRFPLADLHLGRI